MRGMHAVMKGAAVALAAGIALATLAAWPAQAALPAQGSGHAPAAAGWRVRTVVRLGDRAVSVAADPRAGAAYEMVSGTRGGGPFRLVRARLNGASLTRGPQFPVSDVTLAAGQLWVSGGITSGSSTRLVLYQVSPKTLRVVRSWRLTGEQRGGLGLVSVAGGPGRTVWVGFERRLRRLSARTGVVVARARLRAGLSVSHVAVDPAGAHLYVSAAPEQGGAVMFEYAAGSGRLLASASGRPIEFSVSGATLTAVPGGVWASFRTGMAGLTVLLRQRGLHVVQPGGGRGLFNWFFSSSSSYGGGSLWLNVEGGGIGCVAPATGQVRLRAKLRPLADGSQLLAVSPARREVLAFSRGDIDAVTAPARCWRWPGTGPRRRPVS